MTESITLTLPWPPEGLFPNQRPGHWGVRQRLTREFRERVGLTLFAQLSPIPRLHQAEAEFVFVVPTRRRLDLGEALAAFKPGIDSLVDMGLLPDDNPDHLVRLEARREVRRGVERHVRLTLRPVVVEVTR